MIGILKLTLNKLSIKMEQIGGCWTFVIIICQFYNEE